MGIGAGQRGDGGFALLVVILIMLITSFLASQLIMQVRTDLQIAVNSQQRVVGRMLAEGGVNLALFRLIDQPGIGFEEELDGTVFLPGRTYETLLPKGKIEYYATSESGKIDLNSRSSLLLEEFLGYHGLGEEEVDVVVDSLLDWRDNDDLHKLNGAEKNYYGELDNPYIPQNGKIKNPAEFFLIRGTESLKGLFDPYDVFTVNNRGGKININNLTPAMLDFLVGGDETLIQKYREEQKNAGSTGLTLTMFREIVGDVIYVSLRGYLVSSRTASICSIVAHGYVGNFSVEVSGEEVESEGADDIAKRRPATKIRVLVDVDNVKKEFQYLSWREQYV